MGHRAPHDALQGAPRPSPGPGCQQGGRRPWAGAVIESLTAVWHTVQCVRSRWKAGATGLEQGLPPRRGFLFYFLGCCRGPSEVPKAVQRGCRDPSAGVRPNRGSRGAGTSVTLHVGTEEGAPDVVRFPVNAQLCVPDAPGTLGCTPEPEASFRGLSPGNSPASTSQDGPGDGHEADTQVAVRAPSRP